MWQKLHAQAIDVVARLALIAATCGFLIGLYRLALRGILN
jgi:hypothetical protein